MPWIQLKVYAKEDTAEQIGELMSGNGAMAVTFMDSKDTPLYEPKLGELTFWPDTTVIGLFDAGQDMDAVIQRMGRAKVLGEGFSHKLDQLEDKDWEREWMDNFHPIHFGNNVWICPSWCDIPDPDAVNILLDPGLAFGTGTHPTTSLCLQWLAENPPLGKTVLDYGCGSGILAIAALKLGAERVIAVDIDPQALDATLDNAKRNGVEQEIEIYLPHEQPQCQADLVIANILAGPLRELRDLLAGFCKTNGHIVLSGILETQGEELNQIYQDKFDMDAPVYQEEWSRLVGVKP